MKRRRMGLLSGTGRGGFFSALRVALVRSFDQFYVLGARAH